MFSQTNPRYSTTGYIYMHAPRNAYTEGEMTSQSLWPRYDRHFVGKTRYNALS